MKDKIHCQSCKNSFQILEKQRGKYNSCVHCGKKVFIPTHKKTTKKIADTKVKDQYPQKKIVNL